MAKKSGLGKGLDALFADNTGEASSDGLTLRLSEIEPNKNQPRKEFDEQALSELADSIREHGLIQPLLVRKLENGRYQLVAGERRWRACRMIGLDEVPVTVKDLSDAEVMELALIENLQREDLNPLEEAAGYLDLIETYGLSQEQLARRVGKSRSAVANSLRLMGLPEQVRPMVASGRLSAGHARAILGLGDPVEMVALAREVEKKGLSVREVERLVNSKKSEKPEKTGKNAGKTNSYFTELEIAMREELGRKVKIKVSAGGKGSIEIAFFNQEDLASIAEKLAK